MDKRNQYNYVVQRATTLLLKVGYWVVLERNINFEESTILANLFGLMSEIMAFSCFRVFKGILLLKNAKK